MERRLAAILAADVVGYSRLVGADEEGTLRALAAYRKVIDGLAEERSGRIFGIAGDSVIIEFASPVEAVRCAVEIQRELEMRNGDLPEDRRMQFRIGVNLGDVVVEGDDLLGDGVNIAARLETLADPGGICISRAVFDQVKNRLELGYEYLGTQAVKNIADPLSVYRVLMAPEAAGRIIGETTQSAQTWMRISIAIAVVVLVAAAGVVTWLRPWAPDVEPASVERMAFPLPEKPSIAVLPFNNLTGDAAQDYFADGLTDNIITALSQISNLFVIARNSTFTYKGKAVNVKQVAEEQGVRYVMEGSVQKSGDRFRINVQLIDALKGHHLWAELYDRKLKDVLALQDDVIHEVVTALEVTLTEGDQARTRRERTSNAEAFQTYLRGRDHFQRFNKLDNIKARQLFERASELDPNFTESWEELALTHLIAARFGWSETPSESLDLAEKLLHEALAIDDTQADTYSIWSSIVMLKHDYDKAIAHCEKSLAINPNEAAAVAGCASNFSYLGRSEEAVRLIKRAMRLSPFYPDWYLGVLGRAMMDLGRHDEAIAALESYRQRVPKWTEPIYFLAAAYAEAGRHEDARQAALDALKRDSRLTARGIVKKYPYSDPADVERLVAALIAAGLPEVPPLKLPDKPSIAVLPFDNMSGDPEQAYLSDGITESLIARLARQPDMFVIARNSSFTYKGKAVKVQEIGQDLGVRYVLEGSVQKAGNRIRITAQLIEAATGRHLWADNYDRELEDLFAVQDEITQKVAVELAVKLTIGEVARTDVQATDNVEAYDLWLRGVETYRLFKKETNVRAGELFEKAIELDPQYDRAIGYLGWVRLNEFRFYWGEDRDRSFRQAEELARRAIAVNENSVVGNNLLGRIYSMKGLHEQAIAQGRRTVAIEPSSANYYASLALTMVFAGTPQDGVALIEKALRLSPYPPVWYQNVETNINYLTGRHEAAVASARKVLNRTREGFQGRDTWKLLIASYVELGRLAEARAEAKKFLKHNPGFSTKAEAEGRKKTPMNDKSYIGRFIASLGKAGLPE